MTTVRFSFNFELLNFVRCKLLKKSSHGNYSCVPRIRTWMTAICSVQSADGLNTHDCLAARASDHLMNISEPIG